MPAPIIDPIPRSPSLPRQAVPRGETDAASPEIAFLLGFARVGHQAGYGTAELEERVLALAESFGLAAAQVSVTPTLVDLSLGPLARQQTYTLHVRPAGLDLGTIARLDGLVQEVLDGSLDADTALATLDEIRARPPAFSWPVVLGAYALAGAALTPVIGGRWREAVAAALVGLIVGAVALGTKRTPRT